MAFVCKQTVVLVVHINNIGQCLNRLLAIFLTLYFTAYLSRPDWLFFSILKNLDPCDHYAVCCVPLKWGARKVLP